MRHESGQTLGACRSVVERRLTIPETKEAEVDLASSVRMTVASVSVGIRADADGAEASALVAGLSDSERLALRSRPESRRAAFLTGRALIRRLAHPMPPSAAPTSAADPAGEPLRIDAMCIDCGGPHGPLLVDGFMASVTHAAGITAAAVLPHAEAANDGVVAVGLDLESDRADADRVAGIEALTGERFDGTSEALTRWTAIEAVLKADGRGLRVSPAAVRFEDECAGRSVARIADRQEIVYDVHPLDVGTGFVAALAIGRRSV
jgi:4'-phosphopantetheinyl transferase